MTKVCRKCGETKILALFYRRKNGPLQRDNRCKACANLQVARYRALKGDSYRYKRAISEAKYRENNAESIKNKREMTKLAKSAGFVGIRDMLAFQEKCKNLSVT